MKKQKHKSQPIITRFVSGALLLLLFFQTQTACTNATKAGMLGLTGKQNTDSRVFDYLDPSDLRSVSLIDHANNRSVEEYARILSTYYSRTQS